MSEEAVFEIVAKAVTNSQFRALLLAEADKTLEGFDLTPSEAEALREAGSVPLDEFFPIGVALSFPSNGTVEASPSPPKEIRFEFIA